MLIPILSIPLFITQFKELFPEEDKREEAGRQIVDDSSKTPGTISITCNCASIMSSTTPITVAALVTVSVSALLVVPAIVIEVVLKIVLAQLQVVLCSWTGCFAGVFNNFPSSLFSNHLREIIP